MTRDVTEEFKDFVLDQLAGLGHLRSKRMFGGVGLYRDQTFFGILVRNTAYLKVRDLNRADFESRGMKPLWVGKTKKRAKSYTMSYYEVPADILEDAGQFQAWAEKAIQTALE